MGRSPGRKLVRGDPPGIVQQSRPTGAHQGTALIGAFNTGHDKDAPLLAHRICHVPQPERGQERYRRLQRCSLADQGRGDGRRTPDCSEESWYSVSHETLGEWGLGIGVSRVRELPRGSRRKQRASRRRTRAWAAPLRASEGRSPPGGRQSQAQSQPVAGAESSPASECRDRGNFHHLNSQRASEGASAVLLAR